MHRRVSQAATVVTVLALLITGCTSQASNIGMAKDKDAGALDTGFSVSTVGSYDSADTAVVVALDPDNSAVTFMNMDAERQYTLYYDGTTYVKDKYGGPMTISQLRAGDVVDVNFLKGKRQIASVQQSPEAWTYDSVTNYDLGGVNKTASIGSSTYSLPDNVVVFSDGARAEMMDIVSQDVISVRGIDHKIYSINVERGHGYLRLKNDQALIGGWIEVGNAVIREITEDMLLVVPEGSYQVLLSNDGVSSTKDVTVERNKEVVLDVGDLEVAQDKTGRILISVTPAAATVEIDGEEVDISKAVELSYGIHQVHLEAEGYDSLTKYIQVGSEYAKISFTLEKEKEKEESSVSDNTLPEQTPQQGDYTEVKPSVSENTITAAEGNKVYIDAPKNVEVYLDSNYLGISPISFKKTVGSHTVTLRKSGYKTKSYTIYLYNDGEDITYSFTDLEKEESTVSGNNSAAEKGSVSQETTTCKLYITSPKDAVVYLDGNFVGPVPISFSTDVGSHQIRLCRDGFEPVTYTVFPKGDYTYNFPELVEASVSDNDVSEPGDGGSSGGGSDSSDSDGDGDGGDAAGDDREESEDDSADKSQKPGSSSESQQESAPQSAAEARESRQEGESRESEQSAGSQPEEPPQNTTGETGPGIG